MNIIESLNVDLIEPFPLQEAKRAFGWFHAYRNIAESDLSPKTPEEFANQLQVVMDEGGRTFGVIDKYNQLNFRHEAPLVGIVVYEPSTVWNWYIHLASGRRAWGSYFMDEAIKASLDHLFTTNPILLRVSALVMANNGPVKGLARRLKWKFEGRFEDFIVKNGLPCDVLHFSYTRRRWEEERTKGETTLSDESSETPSKSTDMKGEEV